MEFGLQRIALIKVKKADIALHGNPISELRDVTWHMGSQSDTCHLTQVNAPRLTPARQAGTRFTYPRGMEGWVDLVDLIVPRPGVEPATFWSRVRRRTAAPPRQPFISVKVQQSCETFQNELLYYYKDTCFLTQVHIITDPTNPHYGDMALYAARLKI